MTKIAILALLAVAGIQASLAVEFAVPVFRQPYGISDGTNRIVGGEEATRGQFPHQAGVTLDGYAFCGGSLISKNWVLTAGHCVDGFRSWTIVLGAQKIKESNEAGRITLTSTKGIRHEDYDGYTITNDVAVIGLPEDVKLGGQINIIPLPPRAYQKDDFSGKTVRVSGWGKTSDSSTGISPTLRYVDLSIITPDVCKQAYGDIITSTKYCCMGANVKSTCNGDSGGALTIGTGTNLTQLGIVSFGSSRGCALGYPTGFTALPYFVDWVSGKTGIPVQDF